MSLSPNNNNVTKYRDEQTHRAYVEQDEELSRTAHQSAEFAEIAAGNMNILENGPYGDIFTPRFYFTYWSFLMNYMITMAIFYLYLNSINICAFSLFKVSLIFSIIIGIFEVFKSSSIHSFSQYEHSREKWEVFNYPEGEVLEMVAVYKVNGVSDADAKLVATTLSKYDDFWTDHMLMHEVGVLPPKSLKVFRLIPVVIQCIVSSLPSCILLFILGEVNILMVLFSSTLTLCFIYIKSLKFIGQESLLKMHLIYLCVGLSVMYIF